MRNKKGKENALRRTPLCHSPSPSHNLPNLFLPCSCSADTQQTNNPACQQQSKKHIALPLPNPTYNMPIGRTTTHFFNNLEPNHTHSSSPSPKT